MNSRGLLTAVGLFLVAVVVHAWTATLPFQLDDYALLPGVASELGLESGDTPAEVAEQEAIARAGGAGERYLYRPVSWLLWLGIVKAHGGIADPRWFHAAFLALHGAVVVVVFSILRGFRSPRGAILGALAVAIIPGGIQAVSWTAATGDLIATLLMGLATLCTMGRGAARVGIGAACVGLAFLAKESAFLLLPAMALAVCASRPDERLSKRLVILLPALVALFVAWAFRANALGGNWRLSYAYEVGGSQGWDFLAAKAQSFATAILQGMVPWNQHPALSDAGLFPQLAASSLSSVVLALRAGMVAFVGAATLSGFLVDRRFKMSTWLLGALCFVIAMIPATLLFTDDGTNGVSRLLYPPFVVAAVLFGLAWERVHGGWIVGYLLIQMLLASHVASTEAVAASKIRSRLESLGDLVVAHPQANWLALDNEAGVGGIPLLYCNARGAFRPPIARTTHHVTWWGDRTTLDRIPKLWDLPASVRFAVVRGDRYVEDGAPIPEKALRLPKAVAHASGDAITFDDAVPTRSLVALRVKPVTDSTSASDVVVTWHLETGDRTVELGTVDARGGTVLVHTPDDFEWIMGRRVTGLTLKGLRVTGSAELLSAVERAAISEPIAGAIVDPAKPPALVFRPVSTMDAYRVTYDFVLTDGIRFPVVYEVPSSRTEVVSDGWVRFVPREGDAVRWPGHPFHVAWHTLPQAFATELVARGVRRINVAVRVEGVTSALGSPAWKSDWRVFVVEAPSR